MKASNDHIKKLFSEFEPEASGSSIEEGWENIRYFLPQKKKRRGIIWFRNAVMICAALGLIALPVILYTHTSHGDVKEQAGQKLALKTEPKDRKPEQMQSETPNAPTAEQPIQNKKINPQNNLPEEPQKKSYPNATTPQSIAPATKQQQQALPVIEDPQKIPETGSSPEQQQAIAENKKNDPALGTEKEHSTNQLYSDITQPLVSNEVADAKAIAPPSEIALLPINAYTVIPSSLAGDSIRQAPPMGPLLPPVPGRHGQLSLQVFGGINYVSTRLNTKRYNAVNPSVGVAANYQFKSKLSVLAQFVFSGSRLDYRDTLTQSKLLPSKNTQGLTIAAADTIKEYRKAYTESRLSSSVAYNFSCGMGYRFYKRGRLDLSGFLLVNVSKINYQFTEKHTLSAETYTYLSYQPEALPAFAPPNVPQPDKQLNATLTSIGMTPGLLMGYTLFRNTAVIFRPSYCLRLAGQDKFQNLFTVKQNIFYMDVGIRLIL